MRVAVVEAPQQLALREIPMPEPGPTQVLIHVEGSGICASDLAIWEGRPWFSYPLEPGRPGHEGWGIVEEAGSDVDGVRRGDRVASFSTHTYADYDLTEANQVVKLPPALAGKPFPGEPLACAVNAFKRTGIRSGDNVAVVGGGFQGLPVAQLAANAGAKVVVLSRRESVADKAKEMGATAFVSMADYYNAKDEALERIDDEGYDVVIEATGHDWPLNLAAELTRTRGRLIIVGYHQDPRQVNMQLWNWRGLDVINAHERDPAVYVQGLREAVELVIAGELNPYPLIGHSYPLDALDQAFDDAGTRPEGFLKAVVVMT